MYKSPCSVLLVTDEPGEINFLETLLQEQSYFTLLIEKAFSVDEAKKMMESLSFNLVLCDFSIHEQSVFELLPYKQNDTLIIAMVYSEMKTKKSLLIREGIDDLLEKPLQESKVMQIFEDYFPWCRKNSWDAIREKKISSSSLVDLNTLKVFSGGDKRFISDVISVFIKHTSTDVLSLRDAFLERDLEKIASISHKLKSAFPVLGVKYVDEILIELYDYSKNRDHIEKIPFLIDKLEDITQQTITELHGTYN